MIQIKELTISREKVFALTIFIVLVSVAVITPLLKIQALTGTLVNATLFVATVLLGTSSGILIGLVPSLISLAVGLLPPVLAPMIPFIMVGNAILIVVFNYLKEKNYWLGIIVGSLLKFSFLFSVSSIVINLLLKKEMAATVAAMMSWPQLITALSGGVVAFLFLKSIKKI